MEQNIVIRGARQHNLKNINVTIPRNSFTVITGLSGSGKSSLAFDTIYAEGQRRYVESLSSYARQFLGLMDKPDVDFISGLSPAISIDQKSTIHNPRSTVGTVTEIYDHLRLLFARAGTPYCPNCNLVIAPQSPSQITESLLTNTASEPGQFIIILSPVVRGKKGTYEKLFDDFRKQGFSKARIDGVMDVDFSENNPTLERYGSHSIDIFIDKLDASIAEKSRLQESVETALKAGSGLLISLIGRTGSEQLTEMLYSQKNACPKCGFSIEELEPRMFSFNSPFGACTNCHGLGIQSEFDPDLIIPDKTKTLLDGAIEPWNGMFKHFRLQQLSAVGKNYGFDITTPVDMLSKEQLKIILYGTTEDIQFKFKSKTSNSTWQREGGFSGVIPSMQKQIQETESESKREDLRKYQFDFPCPKCKGLRLKPESLSVKLANKNIIEVTNFSISMMPEYFASLKLSDNKQTICKPILKEINSRCGFLIDLGLGYLSLSRAAGTLSGGEAQRIRLATQIGSALTGVLYVLDEPSIGLHARDNSKLIKTLGKLKDLGNTLVVVEHDEETIRSADYVIDLGPGAGVHGGKIVAEGTPKEIMEDKNSLTGAYLRDDLFIRVPWKRRKSQHFISLKGAKGNNLKDLSVKIPIGVFTCVTGVSGGGKSTLILETLEPAIAQKLYSGKRKPLPFDSIEGFSAFDSAITVDQSPIGRTPRSNPATYIGVFSPIRELFASTPSAKSKGFGPGRFSFNVAEGRCANCEGEGLIRIEMHFLPDVYVICEQCKGKRYDAQTLSVTYRDKNIADILDMTVEEALTFFAAHPSINKKLQTVYDVGLGYIKLGQSSTTLSGGEAQRIKLASELAKRDTGRTMYVLDEPTTGLHFQDIDKLLAVLHRLVDKGNTVIVIEHNLDVIKTADWVIDLGPEGGEGGGKIIAEGTPEQVSKIPSSFPGQYLKPIIESRGKTKETNS